MLGCLPADDPCTIPMMPCHQPVRMDRSCCRILRELYRWRVDNPTQYLGQACRDGTSRLSSFWRWLGRRQHAVRELSTSCHSEATCSCTTMLVQMLESSLEIVVIHCERSTPKDWRSLQHVLNEMAHCSRLDRVLVQCRNEVAPHVIDGLDIGPLCHAPHLDSLSVDHSIRIGLTTAIAQLSPLQSLSCAYDSSLLRALPSWTGLWFLDLRGRDPVPEGMVLFPVDGVALSNALSALPKLQCLSLRRLAGLEWLSLADMSQLLQLKLCKLPALTALPAMDSLSGLRALRLDMPLGEEDLETMIGQLLLSGLTALTSLSVLDLGDSGPPDNVLLLHELRELQYDGVWETLPTIGELRELRRITLKSSSSEALILDLAPLASMDSLSVLDLRGCYDIEMIGTATLNEFMHGSRGPRSLHVGACNVNFQFG